MTWTGTRSNGEFLFFTCTLAPGDIAEPATYPLCDVRYYSDLEDLYVSYRYSNDHLDKWREIDDAVWRKLHEWEVNKERGDGAAFVRCGEICIVPTRSGCARTTGSDDSALGGDLAYWYGRNGSFAGISLQAAQQVIGAAGFGSDAQALRPFSGLQDGFVKLS